MYKVCTIFSQVFDVNSQAFLASWFPVIPNTLELALLRKANLIFQSISLPNATLLSTVLLACGVQTLNYIKNDFV